MGKPTLFSYPQKDWRYYEASGSFAIFAFITLVVTSIPHTSASANLLESAQHTLRLFYRPCNVWMTTRFYFLKAMGIDF